MHRKPRLTKRCPACKKKKHITRFYCSAHCRECTLEKNRKRAV